MNEGISLLERHRQQLGDCTVHREVYHHTAQKSQLLLRETLDISSAADTLQGDVLITASY